MFLHALATASSFCGVAVGLISVTARITALYDSHPTMLASDVAALERSPGSIAGTTGVTTFIKTELVGDGGAKPMVPFPCGKGNASQKGIARGRAIDNKFRESVAGIKSPVADRIHRALRGAGITACAAQVRVITAHNKLTTSLDGVGYTTTEPESLWCIELKTCRLNRATYAKYCMQACRRTPMLRCSPPLPNSEITRHYLQAAYGAIGLQQRVGRPCKAIVVVVCADGVLTYLVPAQYQQATYFVRLVPILPRAIKHTPAPRRRPVQSLTAWPTGANAVLARAKLTRVKPQIGKYTWAVANSTGVIVGAVAHVPLWTTMGAGERASVNAHMRAATKKTTGQCARVITPYIITALTKGGQLQISLSGVPITRLRV